MAEARIGERLLRRQCVDADLEAPVRIGLRKVVHLVLIELDINIPDFGHDVDKALEVHLDVAVDRNAEALLDRVIEELHAAVLVGRVDAVVAVALNWHVEVTHDRAERDLLRLCIDAADDHRIGPRPALPRPCVLADEEDVPDILVIDDAVRLIPCDLVRVDRIGPCISLVVKGLAVGRDARDIIADPLDLLQLRVYEYGAYQEENQKNGQDDADNLSRAAVPLLVFVTKGNLRVLLLFFASPFEKILHRPSHPSHEIRISLCTILP